MLSSFGRRFWRQDLLKCIYYITTQKGWTKQMYLTVRGLVLRVTAYKETDAILTVLTENHGKLTLKARGLRRKNSPLIASCQLLAFSEFVLFEYRDFYTINEAHSIELFTSLRKDLSKLSLGTYFAQAAEVVSQEDIPNPELLSLTLNCLYTLSGGNVSEDKIKAVFELRCACVAGYTPDLISCHQCGNSLCDRFDVSAGRIECSACRSSESDGIRLPLSGGMMDAMRYICYCDGKKLFGFTVGDETMQKLAQLTEIFLTTQLERGFSTLDFYKSLM